MNKKRFFIKIVDSDKSLKGSAMVMALLTMLLLAVLGLAVVTLSYSSMKTNTMDNTNNKAYYAAEAGVHSAIEQVKYEVSSYYNKLLSETGSSYNTDYTNFFSTINSNAASDFVQPVISGFSINTNFSLGTFNSSNNTQPFLITCVSTAGDGTKYQVNGNVTIKRVDVSAATGAWSVGNDAIMAGGTLNLATSNGVTVSGGNVEVAAITEKNTWQAGISGGGQLVINPTVGTSINNPITYPSYTTPTLNNPTLYITQNNYTISTSLTSPIITTADGVSVSISNCNITGGGTVYVKGNLTIQSCNCYADVYCDGNLTIKNCTFYGKAYCRGNLTTTSVDFKGDVRCDGSIDMTNGSFTTTTLSGGGINIHSASSVGSLFSAGNITISNAGLSGGVIYSRTGLSIGNMSATAIFYSGGNVTFTGGGSITGSVIAKNNIASSSDSNIWTTVTYSQSTIDNIVSKSSNSFFFTSSTPTLNQDVILGQDIIHAGRVS